MSGKFTVQSRESNRDLHVRLAGSFHIPAAQELGKLLRQRYTGAGRVFFDVRELDAPKAEQHTLFRQCIGPVPPEKVYFKGELGFALAIEGSRVLLMKKGSCRCQGACKTCACRQRAQKARKA